MSKRGKIMLGVAIAVAWVVVLTLAAIFLLPKILNKAQEPAHTPEEVISIAMEGLKGQGTDEPVLLGADGTPVGIAKATGLASLITGKVHYEILSLEVTEDTAVATLSVTAPDTMALVLEALEGMERYDEAIFLERMTGLLEGKTKSLTTTVQVELLRVEDRWCMATNPDFSDAITGGMISRYVELQKAIVEARKKGDEE